MRFLEFIKEKYSYIISIFLVSIIIISTLCILNPVGGPPISFFLGILYFIGAIVPLLIEYITKNNFYRNLLVVFEELDKKNLISELVVQPSFIEGIIFYDVLKGCNKAMLDEINKYKYMQEEYREYIELWVHEIKTPISSSRLIAQNNQNQVMDSVEEELEKIEGFVEQVLFYSRSNNVEKDYLIKEIELKKLCFGVIKNNSKLLIHNNISIATEGLEEKVFTDAKWLEYIINQILTNSIKYMNKTNAQIKISSCKMKNAVELSIEDNGIGIAETELARIFDKGFTGTNGRNNERSTGMGLYICKKLCDKLGLSIKVVSKPGEGTRLNIIFPKSSMMNVR